MPPLNAHFVRRSKVPSVPRQDSQSYRPHVRKDFRRTCAYCLFEEKWAAGVENFEIDHFRPKSLFPQLALSYYNLYWCCHVCNKLKRNLWPTAEGLAFVDLCASTFDENYFAHEDGMWEGKTVAARYTIDVLRLNRPHLVELRRLIYGLDLG